MAILVTIAIDNYVEAPLISLQTLADVMTVMSSILLLAISFKLYRRFSSTQSIIDKQTAVVVELTILLSEAKFSLDQVHAGGRRGSGVLNITIHGYKKHLKKSVDLIPEIGQSSKMYINANMLEFLEHFWKLKYNPYLPKHIALMLRKDFGMMTQASFPKSDMKEGYLEFRSMFTRGSDSLLWKPVEIGMIMKNMKSVHDECNSWLREFNPEAYDSLNLISDRMPNIRD